MSTMQQIIGLIEGEMKKRSTGRLGISDMMQNIIYFFNQPEIRNYVIKHYLDLLPHGKYVDWDQSYYFNEDGMMDSHYHPDHPDTSLTDFIRSREVYKKIKKNHFIIFTCCILYEGSRVHFLSFVYKATVPVLVSFDPGIHLYHKGQDVLVPLIEKSFTEAGLLSATKKPGVERIGLCSKEYFNKKFGIQYDGSNPLHTNLPADSFCQSWTLFFLIEFLRHKCSDRFVSSWCKINPDYRETFILMYYFLPWLQQDKFIYNEWLQFYPEGEDLTVLFQYMINTFAKCENKK